ncbi:MAG: glycosyltransferase family 39 protein [Polyangiaceae bacterium]|nr:glycosyltransferase family 39 protein [Polyangiaceae bacterium]
MSARRKLNWVDGAIASALGTSYAAVLVKTVGQLGYARDEGFYFHAANAYGRWFEAFWTSPKTAVARGAVDNAWGVNHEHPALIKSLFALSNVLLQKKLHLFAMEGTSYRFPAMVLAGALIALVYIWGTEARSRAAGLVAAVSLATFPRVFFHAHLACFDIPIVAVWTLCAYTFWKAIAVQPASGRIYKNLKWPVLAGITFGLALNTKHNSWFLPIVACVHTLATIVIARMWGGALSNQDVRVRLKKTALAMAAMAVLGPVLFWAMWPWIWRDTGSRLVQYALFHLNHDYYNMEFLGVNYFTPPMPRSYAFVMTVATVPAVTLLLALAGFVGRARLRLIMGMSWAARRWVEKNGGVGDGKKPGWVEKALVWKAQIPALEKLGPTGETELLWLLSIGVVYTAWLSPKTPIFGGTKHWMTAYPFIALFAGVGFDDLIRLIKVLLVSKRNSLFQKKQGWLKLPVRAALRWVAPLLGISVLASPIAQSAASHPWGLTSYTPLVGGAPGAATLGLNRGFWGYQTGAIVDFINQAPQGSAVFVHDTAGPSWDMLVSDGRVRKDLRGVGSVDYSRVGLYHHEKHMGGVEYQNWVAYGTRCPAHIAGLDGVPVIWAYTRP